MSFSIQTINHKAKLLWSGHGISYKHQFRCLIPIFITGFLIAILAPTNILSDNPILKAYTDTMSQTFSLCGGKKNKSEFPEVTALYNATTCLGMPFVFLITWKYFNSQINKQNTPLFMDPKKIINRIQLLLTIAFCSILVFGTLLTDSTGESKHVRISTSRFELGLYGSWALSTGVAVFSAVLAFSLKRLFTFNFKGTNA